jgi:hypothetical protein
MLECGRRAAFARLHRVTAFGGRAGWHLTVAFAERAAWSGKTLPLEGCQGHTF